MQIGFGAPVSGAWATPENLAAFASSAERLGYRSLWSFQRLLVPTGSNMEPVYHSVLDPMIALGYASAATTSIRLGVAVLNLPFVSPLYLAKQAATLDVLCGGRLDLGLGIGWMPEEFTASRASTARRGARAEEFVAVLRRLWTGDNEFDGEFYQIPAGRQDPGPVQRPGPPILLGGMSQAAMRRAGRLADGWITSSRADLSAIGSAVEVISEAAVAAGRDPIRIICRGVVRAGMPADEAAHAAAQSAGGGSSAASGASSAASGASGAAGGDSADDGGGLRRPLLSGSFDQIRADTAWLGEQGVTEVFYDLNWDPLIGSPDADPRAATERAAEILEALAPEE